MTIANILPSMGLNHRYIAPTGSIARILPAELLIHEEYAFLNQVYTVGSL